MQTPPYGFNMKPLCNRMGLLSSTNHAFEPANAALQRARFFAIRWKSLLCDFSIRN